MLKQTHSLITPILRFYIKVKTTIGGHPRNAEKSTEVLNVAVPDVGFVKQSAILNSAMVAEEDRVA